MRVPERQYLREPEGKLKASRWHTLERERETPKTRLRTLEPFRQTTFMKRCTAKMSRVSASVCRAQRTCGVLDSTSTCVQRRWSVFHRSRGPVHRRRNAV